MTVAPQDVVGAAQYTREALDGAIGMDWSVCAGRLDWDVDFTLMHTAGALTKSTLYLASRSTRFIAVHMDRWPGASQAEQLDAMVGAAHALANVAAASPPGSRAFHALGMFDAEGYVAMGGKEVLIHGHDCATGLGLPFEPPDDLVRAIVERAFPWLVADHEPPWRALLWYTGRIDIPGRESRGGASWTVLTCPLDEWDGTIPTQDAGTVVEWVQESGRWRPVYVAQDA